MDKNNISDNMNLGK